MSETYKMLLLMDFSPKVDECCLTIGTLDHQTQTVVTDIKKVYGKTAIDLFSTIKEVQDG